MITVKIRYQSTHINNIVVSGHAGYDVHGKDIVCSAVSTCVITTINGILELDKEAISVEQVDGKITIDVQKQNDVVLTLLENMVHMLESLVEQYPKNISLSKEEIR